MVNLMVPVSAGEVIDKLTILDIKAARINDPAKLANVQRERDALAQVAVGLSAEGLDHLWAELAKVNAALWDIEDRIREQEAEGRFDETFVTLARSVYQQNDRRAALKRQINELLGSELIEEKSYAGS